MFAVTESGDVYGWGSNSSGQLGIGVTSEIEELPRKLELSGIVSVHTPEGQAAHPVCAAVAENGLVYTWGCGKDLGLGHGRSFNLS